MHVLRAHTMTTEIQQPYALYALPANTLISARLRVQIMALVSMTTTTIQQRRVSRARPGHTPPPARPHAMIVLLEKPTTTLMPRQHATSVAQAKLALGSGYASYVLSKARFRAQTERYVRYAWQGNGQGQTNVLIAPPARLALAMVIVCRVMNKGRLLAQTRVAASRAALASNQMPTVRLASFAWARRRLHLVSSAQNA